jgi:hypothetical protein
MKLALKSVRGRFASFALIAAFIALTPARGRADMPNPATLLDYGVRGFTLGAETGLAIGYLSTGPIYQNHEWRKLVLGAGVGALAGMTTGFVLAVADVTKRDVPVGYYILRDTSYGTLLGALMGSIVGMLIWVDDGSSKAILQGMAYGTLFGAVAGIIYGIVDARYANGGVRIDNNTDWRLNFAPVPERGGMGVAAGVSKRF